MNLDLILLAMLVKPANGYELHAAFAQTVNHMWPADLSQIYRTLKRLEKSGHLTSRMEPSDRGPDRRVYGRTAAGRRHLHRELAKDPRFADERMPYVAQLFFLHELGDLGATKVCVQKVRQKRQAQLAAYQEFITARRAEFGGSLDDASDEQFHHYLTLEAGIRVAKARLRWCDDALEKIDRRITRNKKRRAV